MEDFGSHSKHPCRPHHKETQSSDTFCDCISRIVSHITACKFYIEYLSVCASLSLLGRSYACYARGSSRNGAV